MPSQRVMDLMSGKTPDRLPWLPELNGGFCVKVLGEPANSDRPYLDLSREVAERIGADHLARVISVKTGRRRVTVETDRATGTTVVHTPRGDLRRIQRPEPNSGTAYTYEHFVKGPECFPAYRAMVEDEVYEPDYQAAQRQIDRSGLATVDVPATPLMHLLMWEMDVQPTLMAVMDYRGQMVELMAAIHERNKEYYRLAAAGPGKILRPMEDTSALLTGPRMYAEHCVPHLNDYARIAHAAGKLFIPHMCGHLGGMLEVLGEVELDGIEAVTPPPLGSADLPEMRWRLGDIWLIGGIDPSMYATAGAEQMTTHARQTLQVMRGDRKFILGHEEIPLAAKMDNVGAVAGLVEKTADWFYHL